MEVLAEHERDLGLGARLQEALDAEAAAGRDHHLVEEHAEVRLIDLQPLLDRVARQADLVSNDTRAVLALAAPDVDALNLVGVSDAQRGRPLGGRRARASALPAPRAAASACASSVVMGVRSRMGSAARVRRGRRVGDGLHLNEEVRVRGAATATVVLVGPVGPRKNAL